MKRLAAILTALAFLFLCGCKDAEEYLSEWTVFVKEKTENVYSNVIDKAEQIGEEISAIITDGDFEEYEIVSVEPQDLSEEGLLAYNKLTKRQKQLYSIFVTAFGDMQLKKIDITDYASDNVFSDASVAHKAVLCDRPDIFWAPKVFSMFFSRGNKNTYIQFSDDKGKSYYGVTKAKRNEMQAELNSAVDRVMSGLSGLDSDFEKELYIHDYLCENITYDSEAAQNIDSADSDSLNVYGALVLGSCVCEGYSRAFQLLCNKAGIPCSVVCGDSEGVAHMWNMVAVSGQTYYTDVTFDDSPTVCVLHQYFNVTKQDIEKDHTFYSQFSSRKTYQSDENINFFTDDCESNEYNYFIKKNLLITGDGAMAVEAMLIEQQSGKKCAELKNITNRSADGAFRLLRRKARNFIELKYYYSFEDNDIIIAVWQD